MRSPKYVISPQDSQELKVLVADNFDKRGLLDMENEGMEVTYNAGLMGEDLAAALAQEQPEVLLVRETQVDRKVIDSVENLQLVVRAGTSIDNIDSEHCSKRGIYVANCPGMYASSVAELTMGLILSIDRRIAESTYQLKTNNWNKAGFRKSKGIKGRVLGLIGIGNVAQQVCQVAKAFGMEVIVSSRTQRPGLDQKLGFTYVSKNELLAEADIVSLHVPLTSETKKIVNVDFLSKMKSDAVLINTSRGDIIDEDVLLAKLESCPNFWVGTDVYNGEPEELVSDDFVHPIAQHPRVYGTHHCGADTLQAERAIGQEAIRVIKDFNSFGVVDKKNWVNSASSVDSAMGKIQVRHLDKVGVLAFCFQVFAGVDWNVQELESVVFKERQAQVANVNFEGDVSRAQEVRESLMANPDVLSVTFQ